MGKKGKSQQKDVKGAALGKKGETQDVSRGKWPTVSNSAKRSSKQGQLATACRKMEVIGIRRCHWVKEKKQKMKKQRVNIHIFKRCLLVRERYVASVFFQDGQYRQYYRYCADGMIHPIPMTGRH